jgi:trimeric autotransporter adhesin
MITITPAGGFIGSVALSCAVTGPAGAVDPPSCSATPQALITGTAAVTATLNVNTTAASAASTATGYIAPHNKPLKGIITVGGATMAALLFVAMSIRRRRWKAMLGLLLFAILDGAAIGCGGAMTNVPAAANPDATIAGTTPGSYTVTVTGTSGDHGHYRGPGHGERESDGFNLAAPGSAPDYAKTS